MFVEAIEKFEELERRLKKLNYGEHNLLNAIKKEALMLIDNFLPKSVKFKEELEKISVNGIKTTKDNMTLDAWIQKHDETINLFHIILEDLRIKQRKSIAKSTDKSEIEKYLDEIERIKNDTGKDLILEKNNYNYLKRKYDMLQYNYDQLQTNYQKVLGQKSNWVLYITWTVLISLFLVIFDQFIQWDWYDIHPRKIYLKITAVLLFANGLLLLPFKKN